MANIILAPNIFGPPNPPNSLGAHLDEVAAGKSKLKLLNPQVEISSLSLQDFVSALTLQTISIHNKTHSVECYVTSLPTRSSKVGEFAEWYLSSLSMLE